VGSLVSALVLRRSLGGLGAPGAGWPSYLARLLVAVLVSTAVALGVRLLLPDLPDDPSTLRALLELAVVGGVGVLAFLGAAKALRINEVTSVLGTVLRRTQRS
jgi:putative peptidoglycan lipid II flippase